MAAPTVIANFSLINNGMIQATDPVTNLPDNLGSSGRLYQAKIALANTGAGATSKAYVLPSGLLIDVEIQALTGTPTCYITLSSNADILAGNAVWVALALSGITKVPLGINALYFVSDGSAETVLVNARLSL